MTGSIIIDDPVGRPIDDNQKELIKKWFADCFEEKDRKIVIAESKVFVYDDGRIKISFGRVTAVIDDLLMILNND